MRDTKELSTALTGAEVLQTGWMCICTTARQRAATQRTQEGDSFIPVQQEALLEHTAKAIEL